MGSAGEGESSGERSLGAEKGKKGDSRVVVSHTHDVNTCKGMEGQGSKEWGVQEGGGHRGGGC